MVVTNPVTVVDLARVMATRHPNLFRMVRGVFRNFRLIVVFFVLFYVGGCVFITIWMRLKTSMPFKFTPLPPPPPMTPLPVGATPEQTHQWRQERSIELETYKQRIAYQQNQDRADAARQQAQVQSEIDIFKLWVGDKAIFMNGVRMIAVFTIVAITVLPIMESVESL